MAAFFAAGFPTKIGNPNLIPEKADTWTIGVVIDSPFKDKPALSDWRVSIDYYLIDITDAIGIESADFVMQRCVGPAYNPTLDINHPYCKLVHRNQTGAIGPLEQTFHNDGRVETSGIDLQINWGMDAGPGRVGVNTLLNYLINKKSAELITLPLVDYAGTLGPFQNGLNGNSYRWRALTDVSYSLNALPLRLTIRWQHLPKIEQEAAANGPTTVTGAPAYDIFDLLGNYQVLDNVSLRFGVENMFNKKPPLMGVDTAPAPGFLPGGFNAQNYDTNGRRFYLGGRVSF
jgi:outer membrane receptor protein involved in Fe transport